MRKSPSPPPLKYLLVQNELSCIIYGLKRRKTLINKQPNDFLHLIVGGDKPFERRQVTINHQQITATFPESDHYEIPTNHCNRSRGKSL
jgi:hypothetical protein